MRPAPARWLGLVAWCVLPLAAAGGSTGPGLLQSVDAARVINPDLAGLQPLPGLNGELLAWGTDATLWRRSAATGRWRAEALPHTATVRALALATPADGGPRLVAVGDDGLLVHRPVADGRWQPATVPSIGPSPAPAWGQVACHGGQCRVVAAGQAPLHSHNGGADWLPEPGRASPEGPLRHLAVSATGRWWLGSDTALWQLAPQADTWQRLPLPGTGARAGRPVLIEAVAADGEGLLVATADGRLHERPARTPVWRSPWRSAQGPFTRLIAGAPGMAEGGPAGSMLAIGERGACAWRAGPAAAWRSCALPSRSSLRALARSGEGRDWVAVLEDGRLMHSADEGRRWRPLTTGLPPPEPGLIEAVAWSPDARGFVAAGAGGLLLQSDAQGQVWQTVHAAPRHHVHDIVATRQGLLAAASHRTLARSTDGGRSWRVRRFDELDEPAFLNALHSDAERGAVVVAGGQGSVMFAADGEHWQTHSSGHGRNHLGLVADARQPQVVLYGTGGAVMRVDLRSGELLLETLPTSAPLYAGFQGPDGEPWLLGGGPETGGVLVRPGARGGWGVQALGPRRLRTGLSTADRQVVILAGDGGTVLRATREGGFDSGDAWQAVAAPSAHWNWLVDTGAALWLGGNAGTLARSIDAGRSWQAVPVPTTAALRRPAFDARRGVWWMPGRDGLLLRSTDGGASWQRVDSHTRAHLRGVHIDPQDGSVLAYGARLVRVAAEPGP